MSAPSPMTPSRISARGPMRAARSAHNCAFRNRSIDNAAVAELIDQPVGNFESAAIGSDVFADYKDRRVAFHLFPDALANGFNQGRLAAAFRAG